MYICKLTVFKDIGVYDRCMVYDSMLTYLKVCIGEGFHWEQGLCNTHTHTQTIRCPKYFSPRPS